MATKTELTKLPEKWCVRAFKEPCEWADIENKSPGIHYITYKKRWGYIDAAMYVLYTEISLEQFKDWVLKSNDNIDQDELCEYCKDNIYEGSVNTGPHNLCEGSRCEEAKEMYLDDNLPEKRYKFNKGDYVVVYEHKGRDYWSDWWIKPGDICVLGGEYWRDDYLQYINEFRCLYVITKDDPEGDGTGRTSETPEFKMRHATEEEISFYNTDDSSGNINDMPSDSISIPELKRSDWDSVTLGPVPRNKLTIEDIQEAKKALDESCVSKGIWEYAAENWSPIYTKDTSTTILPQPKETPQKEELEFTVSKKKKSIKF